MCINSFGMVTASLLEKCHNCHQAQAHLCHHCCSRLSPCCCHCQADNEALNAKLQQTQEELAVKEGQLRCKLNAHELQLKEQIVYNVSSGKICRLWLGGSCQAALQRKAHKQPRDTLQQ